jgi:hypothetical protein
VIIFAYTSINEDGAENGDICNEKLNCIFTSPSIVKHNYVEEDEMGATVVLEDMRNSY